MSNGPLVEHVRSLRSRGLSDEQVVMALRGQNYTNQQISDAIAQANLSNELNLNKQGSFESFNVKSLKEPSNDAAFFGRGGNDKLGFSGSDDLEVPSPSTNEEEPTPDFQFKEPSEELQEAPQIGAPVPTPSREFGPRPGYYGRENTERIEEIAESIVQEKWEDLMRSIGDITLWKDKVRTDIVAIKQELLRTQDRFENLQKAVVGKIKSYDENVNELGSEMKALSKVFDKIIEPLTENIKELSRITKELKGKK